MAALRASLTPIAWAVVFATSATVLAQQNQAVGLGIGAATPEAAAPQPIPLDRGCLGSPCKGVLAAGQCGINDTTCAVGNPDNSPLCSASGCDGKPNCTPPVVSGPTFPVLALPGGDFKVRLEFDIRAPWNAWARTDNPAGTLRTRWAMSPAATWGGNVAGATCEYTASDHTRCWIQVYLGCDDAPLDFGTYSFRAEVCGNSDLCERDPRQCPCWKKIDKDGVRFVVTKEMLGCS